MQGVKEFIDRKIHFTGVKPITIRGFLNEATIDFAIRKRRGESRF